MPNLGWAQLVAQTAESWPLRVAEGLWEAFSASMSWMWIVRSEEQVARRRP